MSDDNPFEAPDAVSNEAYAYPLGDRQPAEFTIGGILTRCWELVVEQPGVIIGTLLIILAVGTIFAVPQYVFQYLAESATSDGNVLMFTAIRLIIQLISALVSLYFSLGAIRVFSEVASGNDADISMVFGEGSRYLSGLGAQILMIIAVILGFLLFIIPGIIAALGLQFGLYVVVQQGKGPVEALTTSWELTDGYKLTIFLMNIVIGLGALMVACVTFGLGVFVIWPVLSLTQAVMYHSLLHLNADARGLQE